MHLHQTHLLIKPFSTSTTSLTWRTQIKQNQLVSQISSILLQRHNWVDLLHTLNLSSKLTQPLFHQILLKTQTNPQISLSFFNWANSNLGFQPHLKSHCKLIQISIHSGLFQPARPILDSLIQTQPTSVLVESMIQACRNSDSQASVLGFLIECYSHKGLFLEGLEVFRETRVHGYVPTIRTCNALLGVLQRKGEPELAWCFYGAVIRNGVWPDQFTWSIIARILGKNGNLERIARMVDMGMYNSVLYNVLIDGYCKRGEFRAALDHLNEMCNRKLNPGFSTYSSILDGACKYGDIEVIEMIRGSMLEKKFIPKSLLSEYDSIIQKFCDLGKTYAAEMFIRRAWEDEKVRLEDATYGCMLRALSRGGRVKEAIELHGVILERGIAVNDSSCYAFVNVLCNEDPSEEVSELLRDMIGRGFSPHAADLSKFITSQCDKRRWREAEDLLNIILEKGFLPDSFCCCSLVEHYCSSGRIDSAIALHDKMEKLKGGLDVTTYNVLLNGFFAKRRVEEAVRVFDYMRAQNLVSSESFSIMIRGLCRAKELRKALRIHDEMMELGLKPERAKYKRLISGFKY